MKVGSRVRVLSGCWAGEEAVVVSIDDRGVNLESTVRKLKWPFTVLTEQHVLNIRTLRSRDHLSTEVLAERFGVGRPTIRKALAEIGEFETCWYSVWNLELVA